MTKEEIKKLAKKVEWTEKEVKNAIEELKNVPSLVDHQEVLRRCIDSETPSARKSKLIRLISKYLKEENIIDILSKWLLQPDVCFNVWAYFNSVDKYNKTQKSFIKSNTFLKRKKDFNPYLLCNEYLDFYLESKIIEIDIEFLMYEVAKKSGFLIFNLKVFQEIASSYFYNPFLNIKHKELVNNLNIPLPNTKKEKEYWLIYVLVKKLEKEMGTLNAFKEIAKLKYSRYEEYDIKSKAGVIKTRYYELKPKAERNNLTVDDIVKRYSLEKVLEDFQN